jgi:glycosyltransferase involved in cell wall biosynthesis
MVPLQGVRTEARAWDADTEAAEIGRFDIGVMPLADGEWERGKCGYKIIQYMACGVPVVASRVGANVDIVRDGEDGLLAGGNAEWVAALERLLQDPALAARLGAAGRRKVEASYSVQARCDELAAALGGGD